MPRVLTSVIANSASTAGVNYVINPSATSGSSVQTAITTLGATGGTLMLGPGTHTWDVVPVIPPGLTNTLRIDGRAARVTLTSGGPRFLDPGRTSATPTGTGFTDDATIPVVSTTGFPSSGTLSFAGEIVAYTGVTANSFTGVTSAAHTAYTTSNLALLAYETIQHVTLENLVIDANSVGGRHHTVFGCKIAGSTSQAFRLNWDDITIRNIRVVNVTSDTGSTNDRVGIYIVSRQKTSGEATTNTIKNILVENYRCEGSNLGVGVVGIATTGQNVNVKISNITVRRWYHDASSLGAGTTPSAFGSMSNIQIGGSGYGDRCLVSDGEGYNSCDDGVEINAMESAQVENVLVEDSWNACFYHKNFRAPANPNAQFVTFKNCTGRRRLAANYGPTLKCDNANSVSLGTIVVENYTHHQSLAALTTSAAMGLQFGASGATTMACDRIVLRGVRIVNESWASTGALTPQTVYLNVSTGTSAASGTAPAKVEIDGLHIRHSGTVTSGSNTWDGVRVGGNVALEMRDAMFDVAVTGAPTNSIRLVNLGNDATWLRGSIRGLVVRSLTDDTAPRGVLLKGVATLTIQDQLRIMDCDFRGGPAGITEVLHTDAAGAGTRLATHYYRNTWKVFPAVGATVSPGGSPFSYVNSDGYRELVTVSGGTVSAIDYAPDGSNFLVTGLTSGPFVVDNGATLKVTYTVAPTMRKAPAH